MQKSLKLCWEIKQVEVEAAIVKWLSHETGPLLVDKSSSKSRQKSLAFVVKEKAFTTKILTLSSKISISCGKLYIFQHTVFFVRSNHQNKALIASSKGVHSLGVRSIDVCSLGAIQTECAFFSVSWTHYFLKVIHCVTPSIMPKSPIVMMQSCQRPRRGVFYLALLFFGIGATPVVFSPSKYRMTIVLCK